MPIDINDIREEKGDTKKVRDSQKARFKPVSLALAACPFAAESVVAQDAQLDAAIEADKAWRKGRF